MTHENRQAWRTRRFTAAGMYRDTLGLAISTSLASNDVDDQPRRAQLV